MSESAQNTPPESEDKGSKSKFVFVENTRTSVYALRWYDDASRPDVNKHPAAEIKLCGPGLNYIATSIADAARARDKPGGKFVEDLAAATNGVLAPCEPLKISSYAALELIKRTGSRQALIEWRKLEKRADVGKALDERLAKRSSGDTE